QLTLADQACVFGPTPTRWPSHPLRVSSPCPARAPAAPRRASEMPRVPCHRHAHTPTRCTSRNVRPPSYLDSRRRHRLHGRNEAESDADTDPFPPSIGGVRMYFSRTRCCPRIFPQHPAAEGRYRVHGCHSTRLACAGYVRHHARLAARPPLCCATPLQSHPEHPQQIDFAVGGLSDSCPRHVDSVHTRRVVGWSAPIPRAAQL
ncbi:hypothetical protein B0H11DRAFT_2436652, partial [Mycena galericulata]